MIRCAEMKLPCCLSFCWLTPRTSLALQAIRGLRGHGRPTPKISQFSGIQRLLMSGDEARGGYIPSPTDRSCGTCRLSVLSYGCHNALKERDRERAQRKCCCPVNATWPQMAKDM